MLPLPGVSQKQIQSFVVAIEDIIKIEPDKLLVASNYGLYIYEIKSKKFQLLDLKDQDNYQLNNIVKLFKTGKGYWANGAGFDVGFYYFDSKFTKAVHYSSRNTSPFKFNNNDVHVLLAESDSAIWLTKRDAGIGIFNPHKNTFKLLDGTGPAMFGTAMAKTAESQYWLSSYEHGVFGIAKSADGKYSFKQYSEKQGLSSELAFDICADNKGNIWTVTQKGPAVLLKGSTRFISFGAQNGFLQHSFIYNCIFQAPDDIMYIGLKSEYVQFNPGALLPTKPGPEINLTSLKIFDKEWNDTFSLDSVMSIDLPWNNNFISASFIALDYTDPDGVQYEWKMDGLDKGWIPATDRRYLSYSGIHPGKYILHIRAKDRQGNQGKEKILAITIHPPFWKTWGFISLCVVAGLALVLFIVRWRITQIRKQERLKADFDKKMAEVEMKALRAQMNPHFLFNCLNSINRYIVINDTVKASGYLTKFSKLIRLILDNSANDTTSLENEIAMLKLYLEMESMRFEGKFTYHIETDRTLAIDTIIIPSMIIQPYIENAIWHGLLNKGDNGHLEINFISKGTEELEVIIEDDGVGRVKAKELKSKNALKNKSYGMKITNDRIKVLNQLYDAAAKVVIEDLYEKNGEAGGTRVILHIPYNQKKKDSIVSE